MAMFGSSDWGDDDDAAHLANTLFTSADGLSSFTKHKRRRVESQEVVQKEGSQERSEQGGRSPPVGTVQSTGTTGIPQKPKGKRSRIRKRKQAGLLADVQHISSKPQLTLKQKRKLKRKRLGLEESNFRETKFAGCSNSQSEQEREMTVETKKARKSMTQPGDSVDLLDNSTDAAPVRVKRASSKQGSARDSKLSSSSTPEVPEAKVSRSCLRLKEDILDADGAASFRVKLQNVKLMEKQSASGDDSKEDAKQDTTGQSQSRQEDVKKRRKRQKKKKNRNKNKFRSAEGNNSTTQNGKGSNSSCMSVQNGTEPTGDTIISLAQENSRTSTQQSVKTVKADTMSEEQGRESVLKVRDSASIIEDNHQLIASTANPETTPSAGTTQRKKKPPFGKLRKVLKNMLPKKEVEKSCPTFKESHSLHLVNLSEEEDSGASSGNRELRTGLDVEVQVDIAMISDTATGPTAKNTCTSTKKLTENMKQKKQNTGASGGVDIRAIQQPTTKAGQSLDKASEGGSDRSSLLRQKMEARLKSARFRQINEILYTSTGEEARRMFEKDPGAFQVYHEGFTAQLQKWPVNPVDKIISWLKRRPSSEVVADFGCGEAKVAQSVKNCVHSFDLMAVNKHVTVCDITQVPLEDETVDVVVFCLSLMGTNTPDFLGEANRVLKLGGVLKVAEVSSRFENITGFIRGLASFGFKLVSKDMSNSHFIMFEFMKISEPKSKGQSAGLELKPCLYKKR